MATTTESLENRDCCVQKKDCSFLDTMDTDVEKAEGNVCFGKWILEELISFSPAPS
jgi:hypothetical protein